VTRQRVLWQSNAPFAPTGYGVQTAQVVQRLIADGHEVAVACNYGLQGAETIWGDVKLYPTGSNAYSDDILFAHSEHWGHGSDLPRLVMVLYDVWPMENPTLERIPKMAAWVPIDHQPAPPKVAKWLRRKNVMPVAMSKFGSRMLDIEGVEHLYVPHAVEKVFAPTRTFTDAAGSVVRGRDVMRVTEDRFVVMMNAANKGRTPPRKCWGENLMAFAVFAKKHDDAILYLHTDVSDSVGGVDVKKLVHACGIPDNQVSYIDQYLYRMNMPQSALAAIYSDADVLLAASAGEGFGVPVVEAQACGTRVIVSNWTAQPELAGPDSWIIDGQPMWDAYQDSWFYTPTIAAIVEALEESYKAPRGASAESVAFAAEYEADRVYAEHWRPVMETLAAWVPDS